MAPLVTLIAVTVVARIAGALGLAYTATWVDAIAVGLAAMFLLTASARLNPRRRAGLVAIVPSSVPRPDLIVAITGVLETLGALGLLIPEGWLSWPRPAAAVGLGVLMLAMFPANITAAREHRRPDAPHTPLLPRTLMQVTFIAAAALVAVG